MKKISFIILACVLFAPHCAAKTGKEALREYREAKAALDKINAADAKEKQELTSRIAALDEENAALYARSLKTVGSERQTVYLQMAKNKLEMVRAALRMFFLDRSTYPASLSHLVPKYIKEIPAVAVEPGGASSRVYLLKKDTYGDDLFDAVNHGNGGWFYVSDKKSPRWGDVYINSDKFTYEGKYAYQY